MTTRYPARIAVKGYAASELDVEHEAVEDDDMFGRLVSQWTGTHVEVYDDEHAEGLAAVACDWSNYIDDQIEDGRFDDCPTTKRHQRAIMVGLSGLSVRLRRLAA